MKNGFILPIVSWLINILQRLSIVEYVKGGFAWLSKKRAKRVLTPEEVRAAKNLGIDVFILGKWLFIIGVTAIGCTGSWAKYLVFYLIATNLFTYFYYHVWQSNYSVSRDLSSQRRRFTNFILSLGFFLFCYAYLYQYHYFMDIEWPDGIVDTNNAIFLSIANAFTLTYGGYAPLTQGVRMLFASELICTFFFFVIIVVNSIPNMKE